MKRNDILLGKRGRNLIAILTSTMVFLCIFGCEKTAPSTDTLNGGAGSNKNKPLSTDTSNPEVVARAFIIAIANNDAQKAAQYIIPEERDEMKKEMEIAMPPLPSNPEIKVKVKNGGIQADVSVLNAKPPLSGGPPFGLDMRLSNGKWWIVK